MVTRNESLAIGAAVLGIGGILLLSRRPVSQQIKSSVTSKEAISIEEAAIITATEAAIAAEEAAQFQLARLESSGIEVSEDFEALILKRATEILEVESNDATVFREDGSRIVTSDATFTSEEIEALGTFEEIRDNVFRETTTNPDGTTTTRVIYTEGAIIF